MHGRLILGLFLGDILLALIVVLLCNIDKGFDLSDEGLHMMMLRHPGEASSLWEYPFFTAPLFRLMGCGIVQARLVRLTGIIVACAVLSKGLFRWLRTNAYAQSLQLPFGFIHLWLFMTIGGLLSYSICPPSLSYNSLTLINVLLLAGLLLLYISYRNKQTRLMKKGIILLLMGFIISLQLFTKFSVALVFLAIIAAAIFSHTGGWKHLFAELIFLLSGMLAAMLFNTVAGGSPLAWLGSTSTDLSFWKEDYNFRTLSSMYLKSVFDSVVNGVVRVIYIPCFFLIWLLFFKRLMFAAGPNERMKKELTVFFHFGVCGLFLLLIIHVVGRELFKSGMSHSLDAAGIYLLVLACLAAGAVVHYGRNQIMTAFHFSQKREFLFVTTLLLVLPYIASGGTYNPIMENSLLYLSSWFGLFMIIGGLIYQKIRSQLLFSFFISFVALVSFGQTVHGYFFSPHRLPDKLSVQSERYKNRKNGESIFLDAGTFNFISRIEQNIRSTTNYRDGDPVISFNTSPGIAYLLNANSPGGGWFYPHTSGRNCHEIINSGIKNLNKTIILLETQTVLPPEMIYCLNGLNIMFPANYTVVGTIHHYRYNAMVNIWAPVHILKT